MTKRHKPRSGSLAYYPRKRAKSEKPSFKAIQAKGDEKILNFYGYKAGMTQIIGKDEHTKSSSFGQSIVVPVTIIECPPLKVFGIRAYKKELNQKKPVFDVFVDKIDKDLLKRIHSFKKKKKKDEKAKDKSTKAKDAEEKAEEKTESRKIIADIEKIKDSLLYIRLLAYTQPRLTGFGKKKPEIVEIQLKGPIEEQIALAKEKIGQELRVEESVKEKSFCDIKAVTKGKGIQGPVKRFGVKTLRPKAKRTRVVGTLGPWNPSTIMWTVARAGQTGYHTRTDFNKKVLSISNETEKINPKGGFKQYGLVKNEYLIVAGSIPGPAKRLVAIRKGFRNPPEERHNVNKIDQIVDAEAVKK